MLHFYNRNLIKLKISTKKVKNRAKKVKEKIKKLGNFQYIFLEG